MTRRTFGQILAGGIAGLMAGGMVLLKRGKSVMMRFGGQGWRPPSGLADCKPIDAAPQDGDVTFTVKHCG